MCGTFTVSFDARVKLFNFYSLDGSDVTHKGAGLLADALKMNQSLQNLRSVVVSPSYISTWLMLGMQGYLRECSSLNKMQIVL